jgi:hypothetical protein
MVKCGVFFAVRTESLNIVQTSVGFIGLRLRLLSLFDGQTEAYFVMPGVNAVFQVLR